MNWFQKQRSILDFAWSSLLRRWKKNLALTMVYTFIVFILASILFFTQAIKQEARIVLKGSPEVIVQKLTAGRQDLVPEGYAEALKKIVAVAGVRGRLWAYYYEPSTRANFTVVVPAAEEMEAGTLAIGYGIARTLKTKVGELIPMKASDGTYQSFEVTKIFSPESELVSSDLIEMSEEDFRKLFSVPDGLYTDLVARVRNEREAFVVADKIRRLLPDTRPILREELLRTQDAIFEWRSGLLFVIFAGAMAAFMIFAWDKATSLSTEERKEMGILKAVGWETSEVIAMKSWEGIVVSLSSFLTGVVLAYCHVFFTSVFLFAPVLKGWAVLYPHFQPIPFIDSGQLIALFFLTVVPYTVATVIPSWKAASIDPDSVMRA